jgi:ABC-type Fe3+-hydroxamate transport system substrate-binding protein
MKIVSLLLVAAASFPAAVVSGQCYTGETKDYFPIKVVPTKAKYFSVQYFNTYKVVSNLAANTSYLLYLCNSTIPSSVNQSAYDAVLEIPLSRVGISETSMITFLEQIGMLSAVKLFLTGRDYIASPCFNDLVKSGSVVLMETAFPSGTYSSAPYQPLDLVTFGSPYDNATLIKTFLTVSEFMETTNRGVFEWVEYFAAFFNKEAEAMAVTQAANNQWNCVAKAAATKTADGPKPKVLWGYYSYYCNGWTVATCPNYYCEYANACSANLTTVTPDFGSISACGSKFLTTAEFVQVGKDADYWFYVAPDWNVTFPTYASQLATMKSVQTKKVFDYQGSGPNAWFEERIGEYYDVLQDFCQTVGTAPALNRPNWFRNVFSEPIGSLGVCSKQPVLPFSFDICTLTGQASGPTSAPAPGPSTTKSASLTKATSFSLIVSLIATILSVKK